MLRPTHDGDAIDQQRRTARRDHVGDRNPRSLLERGEIRHVPHAHHAFLPPQLLIQDRRIESVFPGVRVELAQPFVSGIRLSGLLNGPRHYRSKDRPHRAGRNRIANENLSLPFRIDQIVPILRGVGCLDRVAIVADHFGRQIRAVPVVVRLTGIRIHRRRPRRLIGLEQIFPCRAIECLRRRPKPDIGLRIGLLGADSLQNFLRAHVHPLHVDVGMRLLESPLEVLQQLFPVRRVHDQNRSIVRAARGGSCKCREESRGRYRLRSRRHCGKANPHFI